MMFKKLSRYKSKYFWKLLKDFFIYPFDEIFLKQFDEKFSPHTQHTYATEKK